MSARVILFPPIATPSSPRTPNPPPSSVQRSMISCSPGQAASSSTSIAPGASGSSSAGQRPGSGFAPCSRRSEAGRRRGAGPSRRSRSIATAFRYQCASPAGVGMRLERRVDCSATWVRGSRLSSERTDPPRPGRARARRPARAAVRRAGTIVLRPEATRRSRVGRRARSRCRRRPAPRAAERLGPGQVPTGVQKRAQDLQVLRIRRRRGGMSSGGAMLPLDLPVKFGSRFCKEASAPSMKSGEAPCSPWRVGLGLELLMVVAVDPPVDRGLAVGVRLGGPLLVRPRSA